MNTIRVTFNPPQSYAGMCVYRLGIVMCCLLQSAAFLLLMLGVGVAFISSTPWKPLVAGLFLFVVFWLMGGIIRVVFVHR